MPLAKDKPAASDPQAVALVHAALDAHTGNDRGKVKQFRTVEYRREGVGRGLENEPFDLKWAVSSAWPDRMRVVAEFPGQRTSTLVRDGLTVWQWVVAPGVPPTAPVQSPPELAENIRVDNTGQWLWLLFPLLDDECVFARAPDADIDGVQCPGVHLFHPKLAPAALHFRPDTKLLARIAYEGREGNRAGVQAFHAVDAKPHHGVQLAHRLAQSFDGRQYVDLTLVSLEPKAKLDDALFGPPKP